MPSKSGKMTRGEQMFAEHYARTNDKTYAATKAGYAHADIKAHAIIARPAVQEEIRRQQVAKLFKEALPAAVSCLVSIMTDAKAPAGARVQASKVVLDRTLGADEDGTRKEPHEMSAEEIAEQIAKLEQVAFARAKTVDIAPTVRHDDDMFS